MITYIKAWLYQRTNSVSGELQWVISSNKPRGVQLLGGLDVTASYSMWEPNKPKVATKIHTIYLDNVTDEIVAQMKQHANGTVFYLGVPTSDDEQVQVITPSEYEKLQQEDTTQDSIPV